MNKVLVTNIQRFSLHDGPGIRTTVFLKGCSLHCPWCANPENLHSFPENYIKDGKSGVYGEYLTCEDIYNEIVKDKFFYDQNDETTELGIQRGGITFSGGEPLLQIDVMEPLLMKLKSKNIHVCIETCLFVPEVKLSVALKYVDLFYVDIKILGEKRMCAEILGGDLEQYHSNIKSLFNADKMVVFRIPIIDGLTDDDRNIERIIKFLQIYRPKKVELIKEHNLGKRKYISLGMCPPNLSGVTDEKMDQIKSIIISGTGLPTDICKI